MSCGNGQASFTYRRPSKGSPLLCSLLKLKALKSFLTSFSFASDSKLIGQLTANTLSSGPVQSCLNFICELVSLLVLQLSSQLSPALTLFHPMSIEPGFFFSKGIIHPSIPWTTLYLHNTLPSLWKELPADVQLRGLIAQSSRFCTLRETFSPYTQPLCIGGGIHSLILPSSIRSTCICARHSAGIKGIAQNKIWGDVKVIAV